MLGVGATGMSRNNMVPDVLFWHNVQIYGLLFSKISKLCFPPLLPLDLLFSSLMVLRSRSIWIYFRLTLFNVRISQEGIFSLSVWRAHGIMMASASLDISVDPCNYSVTGVSAGVLNQLILSSEYCWLRSPCTSLPLPTVLLMTHSNTFLLFVRICPYLLTCGATYE